MALEKWSTTAGNNVNANTGINWDEGMAPSVVNDSARSTMGDVRDWYDNAEWPIYGRNGSVNAYSISFVSATVFKFAGTDRRTLLPIGRRVKAGVGAGTIYGTCTDVTLSASDTQATIAWDSGTLDSSLSYVALGIMNSTNNSHPRNLNMSFSDISIAGNLLGAIRGNPDASISDLTITGALTGTLISMVGEQATTSGTSKDFTIPTTARRIIMNFVGCSVDAATSMIVQLGDAGGIEATNYLGAFSALDATPANTQLSTGFILNEADAAAVIHGHIRLELEDASDFTWTANGIIGRSDVAQVGIVAGSKATSQATTTIRLTTGSGAGNFDAGVVNVSYE